MTASNDAAALRAQRVQAGGTGPAGSNGQAAGNPLATADDLRKRFALEDERYEALRDWVRTFLKEGIDFGTIPRLRAEAEFVQARRREGLPAFPLPTHVPPGHRVVRHVRRPARAHLPLLRTHLSGHGHGRR